MTKEKIDMCASRCDILRRTRYHLYNNLARHAYSEYNHKEKRQAQDDDHFIKMYHKRQRKAVEKAVDGN